MWYKLLRDDPEIIYARESHNMIRHWKTFKIFDKTIGIPEHQSTDFIQKLVAHKQGKEERSTSDD
jgi:hypothetical protein